jgi:signal transduction histidine kinase
LQADRTVSDAAARLVQGGSQIQALLDDLLDYKRNKLGFSLDVAVAEIDAAPLFEAELGRLQASHPKRLLEWRTAGDGCGAWDRSRLLQLFDNLVLNAIKHGSQDSPVKVSLTGGADEVLLEVSNQGPAIDGSTLQQIFDPLTRGRRYDNAPARDGSLGLGLYIARQIVLSHGGSIEVRSDQTETTFTVRLPRRR